MKMSYLKWFLLSCLIFLLELQHESRVFLLHVFISFYAWFNIPKTLILLIILNMIFGLLNVKSFQNHSQEMRFGGLVILWDVVFFHFRIKLTIKISLFRKTQGSSSDFLFPFDLYFDTLKVFFATRGILRTAF